jgi:hypothetical protein
MPCAKKVLTRCSNWGYSITSSAPASNVGPHCEAERRGGLEIGDDFHFLNR